MPNEPWKPVVQNREFRTNTREDETESRIPNFKESIPSHQPRVNSTENKNQVSQSRSSKENSHESIRSGDECSYSDSILDNEFFEKPERLPLSELRIHGIKQYHDEVHYYDASGSLIEKCKRYSLSSSSKNKGGINNPSL